MTESEAEALNVILGLCAMEAMDAGLEGYDVLSAALSEIAFSYQLDNSRIGEPSE